MKENRRISTNFIAVRVFLVVCWIFMALNILAAEKVDTELILTSSTLTFILAGMYYFTQSRDLVEFDGADNLFVYSRKNKQVAVIPLENIVRFRFSMFGLSLMMNGGYSYKIIYMYEEGALKGFRLYPRSSDDMTKLIAMTDKKNPKVEIINISFGIEELFERP